MLVLVRILLRQSGKLIVAFDDSELDQLQEVYQQGIKNTVRDFEQITIQQIHDLEPELNVAGALWSPWTGVVDAYSLAKSYERAALEANANSVVIRTSLVYGYVNELSRLNFPLFIISKLRKGERLDITSDQFRSPTYAGDIAHAVLKLIESDYTGILHLSGPTRRSVYEFALEVCKAFDLDPNLLTPVRTQPTTEGNCQRPLSTGLRIEKAKSIINYQSSTINQQSSIINDQLSVINHQSSIN